MTDTDAEYAILTTDAGSDLLAAVAPVAAPGPADLARWRSFAPEPLVRAALRIAAARRRGSSKFSRAWAMWLHETGVEQATAEAVARHKATRFAGFGRVVDLCCGIGGDTIAMASVAGGVIAVDRDAAMCRRVAWNAAAYGVADQVQPVRAAAERFALPEAALVHIDPDRRAAGGKRARQVADYVPGLVALHSLMARTVGGGIKLSPAGDVEESFAAKGREIEIISLGGECKEATVWYGSLATCSRRATVLPAGATLTDRDTPPDSRAPMASRPGRYVFDPDAAVVRAGQVDGLALKLGLARIASGIDYLTGDDPVATPFASCFEIEEVLPFDRKRLRRIVADRKLGPLEIKPRGLDVRPEALRAELRPPGGRPATLLLIGGDGPARVILARRVAEPGNSPIRNL